MALPEYYIGREVIVMKNYELFMAIIAIINLILSVYSMKS